MECAPAARAELVYDATPLAFSVPAPSVEEPSRNVTIPAGMFEPVTTLAVKVTELPTLAGLRDEVKTVTVVKVPTVLIVCGSAAEVLPLKLLSPAYTAVMECVPTPKDEVENVAVPLTSVPAPNVPPPSMKVTMLVGVPEPETTLAVNITELPTFAGLRDEVSTVTVVKGLTAFIV